jgi:Ser/Thr protein kinase RdoA (MazF antagonist)
VTDDQEIPLTGGAWTAGVVRVGDTVRRPATAASAFIATLLSHLAAEGFDGAPRHLGWDERGRDILTYIPGEVIPRWRRRTDDQVAAAAAVLRRMHDASRGLAATLGGGAVGGGEVGGGEVGGGEVVCHRDPSQSNMIFRHGLPMAFIDFDFAAVGDPLEDLGYLCWSWCVSAKPDRGPAAEQARQVRIAADSYGLDADQRRRLPAAIADELVRNERFWQRVLNDENAHITPARATEVLEWTREEAAFVAFNRHTFEAAVQP